MNVYIELLNEFVHRNTSPRPCAEHLSLHKPDESLAGSVIRSEPFFWTLNASAQPHSFARST